jgi:hypothetical protein
MSHDHDEELAELTDKLVEGSLNNEELASLEDQIRDYGDVCEKDLKALFQDLINLRYNYTMEMVSKNIASYLLRPKKTPEQALRDYKKVVFLSKFLLAETQKALDDEKENFED